MIYQLLCQQWTQFGLPIDGEEETQVHDGYSLHSSYEELQRYLRRHDVNQGIELAAEPHRRTYEAATGDCYWVTVSPITYDNVLASDNGGRRYYTHTPEPPDEARGVRRRKVKDDGRG